MDVAYIWGEDVAAADAAAATHLDGVAVRRVDLAADGLEELSVATRSGGLFGPTGVWATGAGTLRAPDARKLTAACPDGVKVALVADRAAPAWLRKALDGRVELVDVTVAKGRGFAGWVRRTAKTAGVRIDADGAEVIADATGVDPARVRSVLWVCTVTGATSPSAAQLSRLVAGWAGDTNAFAAVDAAMDGNHRAAVDAATGVPPAVIAAALRTAALRVAQLEAGDTDGVPRFARRPLDAAMRRGVTSADLRRHNVAVELAVRGDADPAATAEVALARIAAPAR